MDQDLELLMKYPLIESKVHENRRVYTGMVTVGYYDPIAIILTEFEDGFRVTSGLHAEMIGKLGNSLKSPNIIEVLDQIVSVWTETERTKVKNSKLVTRNDVTLYKKVLNEYWELTNFHVKRMMSKLSVDLTRISISALDDSGRTHKLEIEVDFDSSDDDIFKPTKLDLPEEITIKTSSSLIEIFEQFLAHISDLQRYFDILDEIDENCSILDPEKPSWKDTHRRIHLGLNFSMLVTINPLNPSSQPDIKFLGPDRLVEKHRNLLNCRLDNWMSNDVIQSLLSILDFESFPVLPIVSDDSLFNSGECSICFLSRLEDKLPEIVCPNHSCEKCYHIQCLHEWLSSVTSKRIFNQLHGKCPNCEKAITCPLM